MDWILSQPQELSRFDKPRCRISVFYKLPICKNGDVMTVSSIALLQARRTSDLAVASNTWTKFAVQQVVQDIGRCFDATNSRWYPPRGYVHIIGHPRFTGNTDVHSAAIYVNGNAGPRSAIRPYANSLYPSPNIELFCFNPGSWYFEFYVYNWIAGTVLSGSSYFEGYVIPHLQDGLKGWRR